MIVGQNISVHYGNNRVLDGVSLEILPGQVTAILGPNGAGKSTLLHVLTGAHHHFAGTATLDGRALHDIPARELARRRAVLPQTSRLAFNFTVREVVEMGRLPHLENHEPEGETDIIHAAMDKLDIAHFSDRHYLTLSGGERQRVDLARALAQVWPSGQENAALSLFLDEPTNNLDIRHQHEILQAAREMAERGLAVCCVLHDLNLALHYADHCAVLDKGRLQAVGPTDEVMKEALLARVFAVEVRRIETGRGPILDLRG